MEENCNINNIKIITVVQNSGTKIKIHYKQIESEQDFFPAILKLTKQKGKELNEEYYLDALQKLAWKTSGKARTLRYQSRNQEIMNSHRWHESHLRDFGSIILSPIHRIVVRKIGGRSHLRHVHCLVICKNNTVRIKVNK